MIFSKGKESVNISPKLPFWVWIATKGHIVVIALVIYFSIIGIAIAGPSLVKGFPPIPRDERAKFCDGNLQFGESTTQSLVNDFSKLILPLNREGVKALEFPQKALAKLLGSLYAVASLIAPYVKAMISKGSKENSYNTYKCNDYCGFYAWLPLFFFWLWGFYRPRKRK